MLLFLAIMALDDAIVFVNHLKASGHWLIIRDALLIGALHNANQFVRQLQLTFLHHLIITDDVHPYIGSHHRDTVDLIIAKELICNLDNTFLAQQLTIEVITNSNVIGHVFQAEQ